MSKERLEGIKKRLVLLHNAIDVDDETKNYIFKDLKVEWLIERVQELDNEVENLNEITESVLSVNGNYAIENIKLKRQIERYRETIVLALQAPEEHGLSAGLIIKSMSDVLKELEGEE